MDFISVILWNHARKQINLNNLAGNAEEGRRSYLVEGKSRRRGF